VIVLDAQGQDFATKRLKPVEALPGYSGMLVCRRLYESARGAEADGLNVEIGSLFGKTATAIAYGLADRGRGDRLICIDPFEAWPGEEPLAHYLKAFEPQTPQERFMQTLAECEVKNVDLIVAKSQDPQARVAVNGQVRFAFIDGDHRYEGVKADVEWLLPLMAPGGIMVLDDCGANKETWGVHLVVDELVRPAARKELYVGETAQNCVFFEMKGGEA